MTKPQHDDSTLVAIRPIEVRRVPEQLCAKVVFSIPGGDDLTVEIPYSTASSVIEALGHRSKGPKLFDLWNLSNALGGQLTAVTVETNHEGVEFALVMNTGGPTWSASVEPVDALLVGFSLNLPFLMRAASPHAATEVSDMADPRFAYVGGHYGARRWVTSGTNTKVGVDQPPAPNWQPYPPVIASRTTIKQT